MSDDLLAYDDLGSGPPIVLVHGMTFSRRSWQPISDRLAAEHRVVALDLPGHGESTGSGADVRAVGARMAATLAALDVRSPVVVGHSAGALHATGLATLVPTKGVINVDQPLLVGPFAGMLQQLAPALRGPDFTSAFAPFEQMIGVAALPEPERSRLAGTRTVEQSLVLDHWTTPMGLPPAEVQAVIDEMLGHLEVPYLYLAGQPLPEPVRRHLEEHLAQLEVVVWPGTGHLPQHADIDRFVGLVTDFVATVSARA